MAEVIVGSEGRGDRDPDGVVDELLAVLACDEVGEEFIGMTIRAMLRAHDAHSMRDDIFAWPGHVETAARVAAEAFVHLLGADTKSPEPASADEAATTLAEVAYDDWGFEYQDLPFPKVSAWATFANTRRSGTQFTVAQSAPVRDGDVVEAAFAAVMAVMNHEARERFTFRGEAIYDVHREPDESFGPQPTGPAEPESGNYVADIGPFAGVRQRPS